MDFANWAVVSFKDDTGLGRLATQLRTILGIGYRLVASSDNEDKVPGHPVVAPFERRLDSQGDDKHALEALDGLEGIISLERHWWHPNLFALAKRQNIKVVCLPNWEWFDGRDKEWSDCDLFVCQSQFCQKIVRSYGYENTVHIPPALDLSELPSRQIEGPARLFVHNAGIVNEDDRKGTRDVITSFRRVRRKDVKLIVRIQKQVPLPEIDERIDIQFGNLEHPAQLYQQGDCMVQPSKMEGVGLMILEPLACGLPVITTDYPPMNEYVTSRQVLVQKQWFKRKAFSTQWVRHAHLRLPNSADLTKKIEWCAENNLSQISRDNRELAQRIFDPHYLRSLWFSAVEKL